MATATGHSRDWEHYRTPSQDSQGSYIPSNAPRRPSYQHDPLTGDEPVDFDPSRPASAASRRPSTEHTYGLNRSTSTALLSDMLQNGHASRFVNGRDLGHRAITPEGRERELELGEEARGSSARRRSEDAGSSAPRKSSTTSLRREVAEALRPSTPRGTRVAEGDEEEELTPRGVAAAPRSRQPSSGTTSTISKPLHTPPTLLPSGTRTNPLDYSPSRASSARFDPSTSSSSNLHDGPSSRASSPDSAYSHSSVSSEPGDEWATSHLPSGASPPRSPMLAEVARQARHPSLVSAAAGVRESRPVSEFDFAAAYAHSDGSVPPSPAIPPGFTSLPEKPKESPPLPPLPPKLDAAPLAPPDAADALPTDLPQPRPVLALQTPLPSSPIVTAASSPTSAVSTVAPLLPSGAGHLAPDHSDPLPRAASPSPSHHSVSDRPSSRASTRSLGAQPVRPPRRQPSNLSLMSASSARSASDVVAEKEAQPSPPRLPPLPLPAALPSPPPAVPLTAAAAAEQPSTTPPAPALAPETVTPPPAEQPPSTPASPASAARTRPRGLSSVAGSIKQRPPPPNIPEKSRRRTSALMSGPGASRRVPPAGTNGAEGGEKENEGGKTQEKEGAEAVTNFSTPVSPSEFSEGYLRDSFYNAYAASPPGSTLPSPSKPPSHFREASSYEPSPAVSAPPAHDALLPARVGHLRTDSAVSQSTAESHDDFHDAKSVASPALPPLPTMEEESRGPTPAPPPLAVPETVVEVSTPSTTHSARTESPSGAGSERSRAGTPSGSRGDAKARAAAFIADLKRAKQEAAASAGNSPNPDAGASAAEEDERDDVEIVAMSPMSPSVLVSPTTDISAASSPQLPSLPSSPPAPDSPIPPLRTMRSGSAFTTTTIRPVSSPPLPPFPHQQPTKRPSNSSILSAGGFTRPTAREASFSPPTRSASLAALPPLPPSLLRRRPLPMAIQAASELRKARTARERAKIYADKINELAREDSRLQEWMASVRNTSSAIGRMVSPPASPAKLRSARQEGSTATFAPRADSYRAREIPLHSFGPKDLYPASAPYPGVLGKYHSSVGPSSATKPSFFSGLGNRSLGRRASKRDHPTPHHHASSTHSSLRSTISGPIQLTSAPSTLSAASGASLRALNGPRMPIPTSNQNPTPGPFPSRASFDSRTSSPSASPNPDRGVAPSRASFSYGSTPAPSHGGGGTLVIQKSGATVLADVDEDKLDRLADVLPQADRDDLAVALRKAGGDDVLAISVYLSDEAAKR
ncbi:hypothetical protein JCM10207_005695 [Rhodosporidiobolus poonsookiae]